jgi:hypothetical protein
MQTPYTASSELPSQQQQQQQQRYNLPQTRFDMSNTSFFSAAPDSLPPSGVSSQAPIPAHRNASHLKPSSLLSPPDQIPLGRPQVQTSGSFSGEMYPSLPQSNVLTAYLRGQPGEDSDLELYYYRFVSLRSLVTSCANIRQTHFRPGRRRFNLEYTRSLSSIVRISLPNHPLPGPTSTITATPNSISKLSPIPLHRLHL